MAYLLNKTVFLDDFVDREDSVEFHARATVGEVNRALSGVYGVEPCFLERKLNYSAYMFKDVYVTYIHNGRIYAHLKSEENNELRKLRDYIQELS